MTVNTPDPGLEIDRADLRAVTGGWPSPVLLARLRLRFEAILAAKNPWTRIFPGLYRR